MGRVWQSEVLQGQAKGFQSIPTTYSFLLLRRSLYFLTLSQLTVKT